MIHWYAPFIGLTVFILVYDALERLDPIGRIKDND
jgi:hypothetical protein